MRLIAKVIKISHANFHCNCTRYSRLCDSHFLEHSVYNFRSCPLHRSSLFRKVKPVKQASLPLTGVLVSNCCSLALELLTEGIHTPHTDTTGIIFGDSGGWTPHFLNWGVLNAQFLWIITKKTTKTIQVRLVYTNLFTS